VIVAMKKDSRIEFFYDCMKGKKSCVALIREVMDPPRWCVRDKYVESAKFVCRTNEFLHLSAHLLFCKLHILPVVPHAPAEPAHAYPFNIDNPAIDGITALGGMPLEGLVVIARYVEERRMDHGHEK